jgi:hypothetical protein
VSELPSFAAWRHVTARQGFEVLFPRREPDGVVLEGHATGLEADDGWSVRYMIIADASWTTRSARIACRSTTGEHERLLEADGKGGWRIDGTPAPELDGCLDVDLEASACTNALPVRRVALDVGDVADTPAVYVRAADLRVERLEQRYARLSDDAGRRRYDYASPAFGFRAVLSYDSFGLVVDYPGLAERAA